MNMKKLKISLITALLGITSYGQTFIPDDNFEQALIDLGVDDILDDYVLTESIDTIVELDLTYLGISDATGIEDFTALKYFGCSDNNLTELDCSGNPALLYLICDGNDLSNLNLTENFVLQKLWASNNELDELNLSNCLNLEVLDLRANNFSTLDLGINEALTWVNASENELVSINCSGLSNLHNLSCYTNNLTEIDLEGLSELSSLNVGNNGITALELSHCPNLEILQCYANLLESIDVSENLLLNLLVCHNNMLDSLELSNNPILGLLDCKNNRITRLDLTNNANISVLFCNDNELTYLNVKNGNNTLINGLDFRTYNNPDLYCIEVDDPVFSDTYWNLYIDETHTFSADCDYAGVMSEKSIELSIYPQPASEYVMVEVGEAINYQIVDLSGKLIFENRLSRGKHTISTHLLESGIYVFRWQSENKNGARRLHFQFY